MRKSKIKNTYSRGITLIALVITVIILLILAGVSINMLIGRNRIIEQAKVATVETKKAEYRDKVNLIIIDAQISIQNGSEETLIKLIDNKIKEQDWYKTSTMYNEVNEEVEDNGVKLIVRTQDKYEICIRVENGNAYIEYINENEGEQQVIEEELPYLVTTGNQYIDTGFIPNHDTSIEIKFTVLSRKSQGIYGIRKEFEEDTDCLWYINDFDSFRSDFNQEEFYIDISTDSVKDYIVKQEKNKIYVDGSLVKSYSDDTFSTPNNTNYGLLLFNINDNGNVNNNYCAELKFYYCKIWDGDILVRDFIPVIDYKGKVCIYDKVEEKLYYAKYGANQEEFLRNSDFIELKSIESTKAQYIDTGFKPNQDTTVELKGKLLSNANQFLFGARTTAMSKTFSCCYTQSKSMPRFDYNTSQSYYNLNIFNGIHTIKQNKNEFYINNEGGRATYSQFNCDYNLYLFAINTAGVAELYTQMEFYYCKIWDDNTLIRDFIPVLNNSNEICLYDKVRHEYYSKIGDNFILGQQ